MSEINGTKVLSKHEDELLLPDSQTPLLCPVAQSIGVGVDSPRGSPACSGHRT